MLEPISEIIDEKDNGIRPIIVQFQNSDIQPGEETKLDTGVYKKSKNTLIVAAATKDILYTGNIKRKEEDDDPYKRFLLISNKKTGKVRLVAVDIAILAPQLKKKEIDVLDKSVSKLKSVINLNKQFGSKKIKRITEQRERLKMNIEDVKEQLEKTVADIEMPEMESYNLQSSENDSLYSPPIHRDATTKEEVYILNEIVPEEVLSSLEKEANYVLSSDLDELEGINPFIKKHLINLQNSSVSDQLDKCKILLYLHYLMAYVVTPAKNITKRLVICETKEVNSHILDNFSITAGNNRTRPLSMRDKTFCYILVLSMIALDYELDLEDLSKNIKMGIKKLQDFGRVLAFSFQGKSRNVMVLKLPLPPAVSVSPRKRKR